MDEASNPIHPILIVDDEHHIASFIETALASSGLTNFIACEDSRRVTEILSRQPISLILLDLKMPYLGGEDLLSIISRDFPEIPVVIITVVNSIETVVRCIKAGAFDYIAKPLDEGRLYTVVKNALAIAELKQVALALRKCIFAPSLKHPEAFARIITNNKQMIALFQYMESIALTAEPVLITGETGVGKELMAGAIHTLSNRKGPFIAVNVAGLDDSVFADTLFGHVRGAFTGADRMRGGLVEQAAGGTLFLDEIGDLTQASQVKLLRLLQEGDFFPLGQDIPRRSGTRILSATNRNLWSLTRNNEFRRDLNYRLRTHHVHIPPLRDRLDDIPLLVDYFLDEAAVKLNKKKPRVSKEILTILYTYPFPGNIRELRLMIFNALSATQSKILSLTKIKTHIEHEQKGEIEYQKAHIPQNNALGEAVPIMFPAKLPTLKHATESLVREALRRCDGNQSRAAQVLGISQQAVSKRIKRLVEE